MAAGTADYNGPIVIPTGNRQIGMRFGERYTAR